MSMEKIYKMPYFVAILLYAIFVIDNMTDILQLGKVYNTQVVYTLVTEKI